VSQLPGRIDVVVRLYQRTSEQPWHTFSVSGVPDSIAVLIQRASIDVIERLAQRVKGSRPPNLERTIPRSADALKAWLSAREQLRRGQLDSADATITRAVAEDSMFAPALTDAVIIRSWMQFSRGRPYSGLFPLAERAVALSESLPDRFKLRARALLASLRTDGAEVARATNAIIAIDNTDFDAWSLLSYSHVAYGWQYGATEDDMRRTAERALRLDTANATMLSRRAYLAVALNDLEDVRTQLDRLRRSDTTDLLTRGTARGIEALIATDADFAAIIPEIVGAPTANWIGMFRLLRMYRPDRTEQLTTATLSDPTSRNRSTALGAMVQMAVAESRWHVIDSLRGANAFAQLPGFENTIDRLSVAAAITGTALPMRGAVAANRLAIGLPPDSALALLDKRNVWHDGWLIGAFQAMYGDTVLSRRWMAALGTLPSGGSPREYARALRADIASRLALRRGDRTTALAEARQAYQLWDIHTENQFELMPDPAIRFQLASLLRDSGRLDSAAALFSSLMPPTTWMGSLTARAALELGDLQAQRGDSRRAERSYQLALRLWERSEADVAPLRARARRGIRRVSG
jgi:hypothetical protein